VGGELSEGNLIDNQSVTNIYVYEMKKITEVLCLNSWCKFKKCSKKIAKKYVYV